MKQSLLESLCGPLAAVGMDRLRSRENITLYRCLAATPTVLILLFVLWVWWIRTQFQEDFEPRGLLAGGMVAVVGVLLTASLIVAPAALAGSLASEKDRGTLMLLLTTKVTPGEIVLGKLIPRLTFLATVLAASVPLVAVLAGLAGMGWLVMLLFCGLPLATAFGAAGLALAVSSISRKGRDALVGVFAIEAVLLLVPLFFVGLLPQLPVEAQLAAEALFRINPFFASVVLGFRESGDLSTAVQFGLTTVAIWTAMGVGGTLFAGWRLVPIYLKQIGGNSHRRAVRERQPYDVGDHPMLWKELKIGDGRAEHIVIRVLAFVLMAVVLVTTVGLCIIVAIKLFGYQLTPRGLQIETLLLQWAGLSSLPLSWAIQWTVGLRAALTVTGEKERDTWDTLLTTPLEGREIILPKIQGALKKNWLLLLVAGGLWFSIWLAEGLASDQLEMRVTMTTELVTRLANTVVISVFMAAVGVWASTLTANANRAMTVTLSLWLAAGLVIAVIATVLASVAAILFFILYQIAESMGWGKVAGAISLLEWGHGFTIFRLLIFGALAWFMGWQCRLNFDRWAGRSWLRQYIPRPPPHAYRNLSPITAAPTGWRPAAQQILGQAPPKPPPVPLPKIGTPSEFDPPAVGE